MVFCMLCASNTARPRAATLDTYILSGYYTVVLSIFNSTTYMVDLFCGSVQCGAVLLISKTLLVWIERACFNAPLVWEGAGPLPGRAEAKKYLNVCVLKLFSGLSTIYASVLYG